METNLEGGMAEATEVQTEPSRSGSSITDIISRTLLIGLGAAALTIDRVQAVVDDFVRRGQLTTEEAKGLVEDLTNRSKDEAKSIAKRFDSSLQTTYRELGIASRRDLEDLEFRLRQAEHRLGLLERQQDAAGGPYSQGD